MKKTKRKILYWLSMLKLFPSRALNPIASLVALFGNHTTYQGIRIFAYDDEKNREKYQKATIEALKKIEAIDPRRFKRVRKEINLITVGSHIRVMGYERIGKICQIDLKDFQFEDYPEYAINLYAKQLVQAATYGTVYANYIFFDRSNGLRIQKIAHLETQRFASRLDTAEKKWSVILIKPFDESKFIRDWEESPSKKLKRYGGKLKSTKEQESF